MGTEVQFYDFRDLVVPTTIKNEHVGRALRIEQDADTVDRAYIFSPEERDQALKSLGIATLRDGLPACDFAVANGTEFKNETSPFTHTQAKTMNYWLRPGKFKSFEDYFKNQTGIVSGVDACDIDAGIAPVMNLDLEKIMQLQKQIPGFGKINAIKDKNGKTMYHTIAIGSWPEKIAKETNELEWLYHYEPNRFLATGKTFIDIEKKFIVPEEDWNNPYYDHVISQNVNVEYNFQGKYYVRAKNHPEYNHGEGGFKQEAKTGYVWLEEQPKQWIILNDKEALKALNSTKHGKAKTMTIWAGEVMRSGIPFYPYEVTRHESRWETLNVVYQNSMVRDYLNGEGKFRECNFLTESLVTPAGIYRNQEILISNDKEQNQSLLVTKELKKLSQLNREMIRGAIQLKHPEININKFYQDLGKVMGYLDETEKQQSGEERSL